MTRYGGGGGGRFGGYRGRGGGRANPNANNMPLSNRRW
jgi:ATP-dependent RNA helicase DDX5/DBP2